MVNCGDVFEISTPKGVSYFQYTHRDKEYGHLIRILPGLHTSPPVQPGALAQKKELYFTYFPLTAAVNKGLVKKVAHANIPLGSERPTRMRRAGARDRSGKVLTWLIIDGSRESMVRQLHEEDRELSIASIWNDTLLAERIATGWLPEHES